jgi:hypothetical protein
MAEEIAGDHFKQAQARRVEEEARKLLSNEAGFLHRTIWQTALPTSPFPGNEFEIKAGTNRICVQAPRPFEIPWGPYPRAIMAWIGTQVSLSKHLGADSRLIVLGDSLLDFMTAVTQRRSGTVDGALDIPALAGQLRNLLGCRLLCTAGRGLNQMRFQSTSIAAASRITWNPSKGDTHGMSDTFFKLDEQLWGDLIAYAVPIDPDAVSSLWPGCLAMDLHLWLTYRAALLRREGRHSVQIHWNLLEPVFGLSATSLQTLKPKFLSALKDVVAVSPDVEMHELATGVAFELKRMSSHSVTVLKP